MLNSLVKHLKGFLLYLVCFCPLCQSVRKPLRDLNTLSGSLVYK
ncbi:hypothetical protein FTUN_4849 [Frigoriglobus tundricola]|uniref:Uncharacterized protein n=1 Tax=Frigoriglobus tundricola TaxID=2774151 RepID=A0A6M5YTS6_9BACT|nr:hypothetical protein FTUN_4849 [Frigoriglobus tundricola]